MRAIGYVRVSSEEQVREGVSLDAQEARIRAFCEAKAWELVSVVREEGRSAKDLNRPGLQEIMAALGKRHRPFDAVVVVKLDRLTRSVKDLGTLTEGFRRARVGFTSIQEAVDTTSAAGELFFNIVASISQWERRVIGERTAAALAHLRATGRRAGAVPFGFILGADGKSLEPDVTEQPVLAELQRLRVAGWSYGRLAKWLNSQGVRPKRARAWWAESVRSVLAHSHSERVA